MCGQETSSNKPRHGALVVITPPRDSSITPLSGSLLLYSPFQGPSLVATHAKLTGYLGKKHLFWPRRNKYSVVIHDTGDLTLTTEQCGQFRCFHFDTSALVAEEGDDDGLASIATELDEPLSLCVGGEGIVGRRVSIFAGVRNDNDEAKEKDHDSVLNFNSRAKEIEPPVLIAEGIVGINQLVDPPHITTRSRLS